MDTARWRLGGGLAGLAPQQGVFVEVEPVLTDGGGSPAAEVAAAACRNDSPRHPIVELMLPGGAVLRGYQIIPTGGRA